MSRTGKLTIPAGADRLTIAPAFCCADRRDGTVLGTGFRAKRKTGRAG